MITEMCAKCWPHQLRFNNRDVRPDEMMLRCCSGAITVLHSVDGAKIDVVTKAQNASNPL